MPALLLILPVSMKSGRNFGQHAVLSLFSLLLLCFPIGTAKVCFDSSGGKYLLVIEYIMLHTVQMSLLLCSLLMSTVFGTHFSDHIRSYDGPG